MDLFKLLAARAIGRGSAAKTAAAAAMLDHDLGTSLVAGALVRGSDGGRELEYIESDGAQYINTGVLPSEDLTITVEFCHESENVECAPRQYIFGTYNKVGSTVYSRTQFMHGGDGTIGSGATKLDGICGWSQNWGRVSFAEMHTTMKTIIADNFGFRFSGEGRLFYSNSQVFTNPIPIFLFACNESGTANWFSKGVRIARTLFEKSGVLIADFVPWELGGQVGMMETVSGTFHANAGEGEFLKGGYV